MSLSNILKGILNLQKKIDINKLPSQGLFYKDGFEIRIKKAEMEDIIEYEYEYEKEDLGLVISRVKKIVENNVILSKGFTYSDIKSADIVYLFLEIVKFTNNKNINIKYFDDSIGENSIIQFDSTNFNYMKLTNNIMKKYDSQTKEFVIDGFRYSLPCIGVENSLTNFLISKSVEEDVEVYNDYSYDFLYFLGHKSRLSFSEIENLIQIFNFDLSDEDKEKARNIIKSLSSFGKYSLKRNSRVIDVTAKIDLEKIWRI
jgi:hypothetical protein